ncbi:protein phosphatase 2C domain-containing protein [Metamycoplasma subdolum]|uniref:PP2C family protein-serine/threonine phosphatase n=1 Tax=Metamycoplasma subdolum TaxID=92407 RepID=UPI00298CD293|nr:protein phosphatase 2C domain-containing protein [Metamycoplasma subdolum]WPB50509.1 protein phosphatase 2C domain-containing protein [Metamycoplasma subdolum]
MNYSYRSDVGLIRPENQDRVGVSHKEGWTLAVLCDGMGGHYGGAKCAEISLSSFQDSFLNFFPFNTSYQNKEVITAWFVNAIGDAKRKLINFAKQNPQYSDMGTTLTCALIFGAKKHVYVFNIGDSRTYIYNGLLYQVTEDQNIFNKRLREGWSSYEAYADPNKKKLTSCLGPNKINSYNGNVFNETSNAQVVILTSDGLHDFIDKPIFEQVVSRNDLNLEEKAENLVLYAKKNASNDNISIVMVEL